MDIAGGTVWELVREHAECAPRNVAIRCEGFDLTYAELVERTTVLAAEFGALVAPGSLIGLETSLVPNSTVAVLAAARANCAVLPMGKDSPLRYKARVISDARPAAFVRELPDGLLATTRDWPEEVGLEPYQARDGLQDIAYVMYTSGSTGRPKGVVVPHSALVDRLLGLALVPGLAAGEKMVAMTAPTFDISMAELLLPLTVGGSVLGASPQTRLDPRRFADLVERERPDVIQATPSFWRLVVARRWPGAEGSRIWCGGEVLTPRLAEQLLPRCRELWNVYGPTEATIWATAALVSQSSAVALGTALPNSGVCLFADGAETGSRPDEAGCVGEIALYGAGLARGYLDQSELTEQRFRMRETPDGPRMCYLTGDRARVRDDGTLNFLGRLDGQVKLRGHRVELGEIEKVIEECPGVAEVVALVRNPDLGDRAYIEVQVVAAPTVAEDDLRRWGDARLPAVMRPARITIVDSLPRTPAGKVDRVLLATSG